MTILIKEGITTTDTQFFAENPNISVAPGFQWRDLGYEVVFPTDKPENSTKWIPKQTIKGHWIQEWQ